MAWTAPRTWTVGEIVTKAIMDPHIRDNLRYLKGLDGAATFEDDLTVDNLITTGNVDGVDVSAHKAGTAKAQHTGGAGDHTHQSSGAEGAQLDHGLALTGLTHDDHTQYQLKSLLTTQSDIIYATGASTWARLAKGTGGQILRMNVGATAPEWHAGVATKEIFSPADSETAQAVNAHRGVLVDGAGESAFMRLLIPQDFAGITDIEVIFNPQETGASMHFAITTYYGAYDGGEAYNVHSETVAASDIGATVQDQNLAYSIAGLVDAAAPVAGDLLLVLVAYNATAVDSAGYVVGLRLKYT